LSDALKGGQKGRGRREEGGGWRVEVEVEGGGWRVKDGGPVARDERM